MSSPNLELPEAFQKSYKTHTAYPRNLIYKPSYNGALQAYIARLNNAEAGLFVNDENEIKVPFRDVKRFGHGFERQNILSDEALKSWLGDRSIVDPLDSAHDGDLATKEDPACRFIFIYADDSRSPLKLSRTMLTRILSYHQVMPNYLDFMSVFGSQSDPRDLRFSGFRDQTLLTVPPRGPFVPSLSRSGQQFQLCYNLKSPICVSAVGTPTKDKDWSIRQAAFHHQFDVVNGTTLWIITKGNLDLKSRIEELTGKDGRQEDKTFGNPSESFRSSLAVHLLFSHWATEEWRYYIQWLEQVIDRETNVALYGPRGRADARHMYTPNDLQNVQIREDHTNAAIMILEANAEVMTSLRTYYERLGHSRDFPCRDECSEDILAFITQLDDMIYDSTMNISRAKLLIRITAARKTLILQYLHSQATENMEDLTVSMGKIGSMSQREAIAVKIITVVTLIYLPATFVSTFFSTDVVKYQNLGGNSSGTGDAPSQSFSSTALFRWLEITLPLTFITLLASYLFYQFIVGQQKRDWRHFHKEPSKESLS